MSTGKIGFFDSGVGGLTVLESAQGKIPRLSFYYLGDTKHCPYGDRPLTEVRQFALDAINFLRHQGCEEIVLACNISSSIALEPARKQYPEVTFHGLINDELVTETLSRTQNNRVGVLATSGTVKSGFYQERLEPAGIEVIQQACSPLVPMIEAGHHQGPLIRQTLEPLLAPILKQNCDTVILGCTHYPFLSDVIQNLLGDNVELVDPAVVMARRLGRTYSQDDGRAPEQHFAATGERQSLKVTLEQDLHYENVTIKNVTLREAATE